MAIYASESPAQSTSSLSDTDDYPERTDSFSEKVQPARWSSVGHSADPAQQRQRQHGPVSRLPPELLIHVLKKLGSLRDLQACLLVSRHWCECGVELVWHKPHLRNERALRRMLRVLVRPDPSFTYADFIRRLNFSLMSTDISNTDITRLMTCSKLERLTLMNCKQVTDDALTQLLVCTPELVALDIQGITEATDATLLAAASTCSKLQGLNVTNCKRVTDLGMIAIARSCRYLRRIKLASVENVTDEAITALARNCPRLLELDLTRCAQITDAGVRELWANLVDLRELKVSYCSNLTEAAHPSPPNANPFALNIAGPDTSSPLLLQHQFDHFRILELSGCPLVTDEAIAGIVTHAPRIRSLSLAKCSNLTDNALGSIARLGHHLHDLHLGHVNRITDTAVCTLARACLKLRYVDLACCNNLTDMSVLELAQLQKLRRIGLVRVTRLTDQAVFALGDRQATLERIHLSYCENITVPAIHYLLQRLPKLMHLSLTGVPSFRVPDLQQYCRQPPSEFTDNQRAAFCVFSGKGVNDLRQHLQDVMAQLTDELGGGRSDTEDDDDDEEFPSMHGLPPQLLDSHHTQMAFLNAPNTIVGYNGHRRNGANGHAHPPSHAHAHAHAHPHAHPHAPALHATLQNFRQNSFGAASSSSMTTPDGVTPRGPNARSASSLQLNGTGWMGVSYVPPADELAATLQQYVSVQGVQGGRRQRNGAVPFETAGASTSATVRDDASTPSHRRHSQQTIPFPDGSSAALGLQFDPMNVDPPTPGPSNHEESRGRRVRRSLRNTLTAAESFFRGGSRDAHPAGSAGR